MPTLERTKTPHFLLYFLMAYFVVNLFFLTRFPFVHSDEAWLSGLARNMAETGHFSVTEPFFDLKIRHPHAIKIIFHLLQIVFMKILGYHIFGMRVLSLCFGILTLFYFFRLARSIFQEEWLSLAAVLFLGLDVQFVYASHFARQEIILVFVLVLALHYFFSHLPEHRIRHDLVLATIIGLSIGIHPNSFVISLPFVLVYLFHILATKRLCAINLLYYLVPLALYATGFILLSLSFDPDFFANYARYGEEFEVFNPLASKLAELRYYYLKLYHQVSGTYYTPDIRLQFMLFPAALVVSLGVILAALAREVKLTPDQEKIAAVILSIAAVNLGTVLIGRYNQTGVIFQFPLFYLLVTYIISCLSRLPEWRPVLLKHFRSRFHSKFFLAACLLLPVLLFFNTAVNAAPFLRHDYRHYLQEIGRIVQPEDTVLANLNAEYYFANGRLHDYRNLAFLENRGMTFAGYIRENNIHYIIYPEEMDLIYREKPKWDGLYGPLRYYGEMQDFLENKCELVHEFTDRIYGMRIAGYINTRDWKIKIYRVL